MVHQDICGKNFGEKCLGFLRESSILQKRKFEITEGTEQAPERRAVTDRSSVEVTDQE